MGYVFSSRTRPYAEPCWCYPIGVFMLPILNSVEQLKISCPKWGQEFQNIINDNWPRVGIFLTEMTLEEEKLVLEALKHGYEKCINDPEFGKNQLADSTYYGLVIEKYKELIDMIEKEIHYIECGKLILQEDGTAVLNKNYKNMNQVEKQCEDRAIIRCGKMLCTKDNAMQFVKVCERYKSQILGIDAYYLHEDKIQPSLENSVDYSSNDTQKMDNIYSEAINFLKEKSDELYFEIVCMD